MDRKYASVLHRFPVYAHAADGICRRSGVTRLGQLTAQVTAPLLYSYVWYVLGQAERMGLKRLYFLSESGNAMLEIAREITKVCPVSLELRYLYCSEAALCLPALHRMDAEEAVSVLFRKPAVRTLDHILRRAAFTAEQCHSLRTELLLPEDRRQLSKTDYAALCAALRSSVKFRNMMMENSRSAHAAASGYLMQMGLADGTAFGIVHAGPTCSVQRYLHLLSEQILPVTGFYFALCTPPKAAADGTYHTWYFSEESTARVYTRFCWPLFHCMCAPSHGKTIGYTQDVNGQYAPVLTKKHPDENMSEEQIAICREFAALCTDEITYTEFPSQPMHKLSEQLLTRLMLRPTPEEAQIFGNFTKNDIPLISLQDKTAIHDLLRKRNTLSPDILPWPYGALAVSGLHCKGLRQLIMQKQDAAACLLDRFKTP